MSARTQIIYNSFVCVQYISYQILISSDIIVYLLHIGLLK